MEANAKKTAAQIDQEIEIYRAQIDKLDDRLEQMGREAEKCRNSQRSYMARILMCEQERASLTAEVAR